MFLTSLSTAGIYEPADHTSQDKQRPPPSGSSRGASGGGLLYKLFGAVHAFTLHGFAASGAATQTRRACPHEPTQSNETPHGNTSSDNHQPASPQ